MFRFILPALLIAMPVMAQDRTEMCATTSGIAGSAVAERNAGSDQMAAADAIIAGLGEASDDYAGAVDPIVAWVWTLPDEQLTDEVATAYQAACLAQ